MFKVVTSGPAVARVLLEVALTTWLLAVPLVLYLGQPQPSSGWPVLTLGLAFVGCLSGLLGGLRLPLFPGGWRRRLLRELGAASAVLTMLWVAACLALTIGALLAPEAIRLLLDPVVFAFSAPSLALFAVALALLAYSLVRGVRNVWPVWDQMRRTRLLWTLTHAQAQAGLVLALALVVTVLVINHGLGAVTFPERQGYSGLARLLVLVLPEAIALLILSAAAVVVIVPPAALLTFLVLRQTTRRLEDLAGATATLRAGDLATRVAVEGEDEVARLQADFNAMAADLEQTLRSLQDEKERVARLLAAQRELTASVSHELRTPVATLRGYLDSSLARWDNAIRPTLHQDLAIMALETERLERLIEDMFTLARAEVGRLALRIEPTALEPLLRRCVVVTAPLAWERARVEVLLQSLPALPCAKVDPGRLEQVIRNLIANAVRHTTPGGLVVLSAQLEEGEVVVQVRDSGEGIPPEEAPRVWERFYRADNSRSRHDGGAGLGLALVKELTEAMGGRVSVASTIGEGSCFTLRLPIA